MNSRFFAGEESSESENASDEEVKQPKARRWAFSSSSESEDAGGRVAKSKKDKRFEELNQIIKQIKNHINITDFTALLTDFENLNKEKQKAKQIIENEGMPKFYYKGLALLEDSLAEITKEAQKKFNKQNNRAFNTLKNKLKKHNKEYETELKEYRENPLVTEEEQEPEEQEEEEEEEGEGEEEEEDEDEEDEDEEDESESEEEKPLDTAEARRQKWVKKAGEESSSSEDEGDIDAFSDDDNDADDENKGKIEATTQETPIVDKPEKVFDETKLPERDEITFELNEENIKKHLKTLNEKRGRSGYNARSAINQLTKLLSAEIKDFFLKIELYICLLNCRFETSKNTLENHMNGTFWNATAEDLRSLLSLLQQKPNFFLQETLEEEPKDEQDSNKILANIVNFLERLHSELHKAYQALEPSSLNYVSRLSDQIKLIALSHLVLQYYQRAKNEHAQARAVMIYLEHTYYKHDSLLQKLREKAIQKGDPDTTHYFFETNTSEKIYKYCSLVYEYGREIEKGKATLFHVYHHSLHGRFYEARDLLLMSKIHQKIVNMDKATQILYNRVLVALGISAFQNGLFYESQMCLSELCTYGRIKEATGQRIHSRKNMTADQKREERKHLLPYHMHIDLEFVEGLHLISAMLLEVPIVTKNHYNIQFKLVSKHFRKIMENFEKNIFTLSIQNPKGYIVGSARHLHSGEWKECYSMLKALPIWKNFPEKEEVMKHLKSKIKEVALTTYIIRTNKFYNAYSYDQLCEMFKITLQQLKMVVSKLILSGDLRGALKEENKTISVNSKEPTQLQYLSLQLTEKAGTLVENNERFVDLFAGCYGFQETGMTIKKKGALPHYRARGKRNTQSHYQNRHHQFKKKTYYA